MRVEHRRADQAVLAGTNHHERLNVFIQPTQDDQVAVKLLRLIGREIGLDFARGNGVRKIEEFLANHERTGEPRINLKIEWSLAEIDRQKRFMEYVEKAVH